MANELLRTLSAIVAATALTAACDRGAPAVIVEPIKSGENRLTVELTRNPKCGYLIGEYGDTAYRLMDNNARGVVDFYIETGLVSQEAGPILSYSFRLRGKDVRVLQLQSGENEATLRRLGNEILEKACSNAEQNTTLHQQLNPHMYGASGVLKPQYAPRMLHL